MEREKVTITNEYFELIETHKRVFDNLITKQFPAKVSYWIARAISKVETEHTTYSKFKNELLKTHAKTKNGQLVKNKNGYVEWVSPYEQEEYIKKIMEIKDAVIYLDIGYIYVDFDKLNITLSPMEATLLPFLKDISEKPEEETE